MIDPYKVLQVNPKSFTYEELKNNYKKLVIKYHPDRSVDIKSTPVFQTLTFSYSYLLDELAKREESKCHHSLKTQATNDIKQQGTGTNDIKQQGLERSGKFDIKQFNDYFEKNKFNDPIVENGYKDWFVSDKVEDKGAIIHYQDPDPLLSSSSRFGNVYELGLNKIDDFSSDNLCNKSLLYTDLKKAYTTSKIINEDHIEKRPNIKTLDDIKKHRAKISFVMSDEELKKHNLKLQAEKLKEEERQKNIEKQNTVISKLYNLSSTFIASLANK